MQQNDRSATQQKSQSEAECKLQEQPCLQHASEEDSSSHFPRAIAHPLPSKNTDSSIDAFAHAIHTAITCYLQLYEAGVIKEKANRKHA